MTTLSVMSIFDSAFSTKQFFDAPETSRYGNQQIPKRWAIVRFSVRVILSVRNAIWRPHKYPGEYMLLLKGRNQILFPCVFVLTNFVLPGIAQHFSQV